MFWGSFILYFAQKVIIFQDFWPADGQTWVPGMVEDDPKIFQKVSEKSSKHIFCENPQKIFVGKSSENLARKPLWSVPQPRRDAGGRRYELHDPCELDSSRRVFIARSG